MQLIIPRSDKAIIRRWFAGDDDAVDKVCAALEQAEPRLHVHLLAEDIAPKLDVPASELTSLLNVQVTLINTLLEQLGGVNDEALELIVRAVLGHDAEEETARRFRSRLKRIIGCKPMQITAKAWRIVTENQRNFVSARTITELRPLFSEGNLKADVGIVVHQLKIAYHSPPKGNERKILYLALDRGDIVALQKVLERALAKEDGLRSDANLGMKLLGP